MLSFSDEVEHVWKARWSLPKTFFLFVRYAVPFALILHTYREFITSEIFSLLDLWYRAWRLE